jgi:hypothetical protein
MLYVPQMEWENWYNGRHCLVTVDGTDFAIFEPVPFSSKWYSHKLKRAGLRYEIAICIQMGESVWINGPFPSGSWSDLMIARYALVDALDDGECYLADSRYRDGKQFSVTPSGMHSFSDRQQSAVRSRHETLNKHYKDWGALRWLYRHSPVSHSKVMHAIVNIVQVTILNGEPLFQVEYQD